MMRDGHSLSVTRRRPLQAGAAGLGAAAVGRSFALPTATRAQSNRAANQELAVAMSQLQPTLDPRIDWTFIGGSLIYWAYDGLYRNVGEDKVQTIPALADGMPTISADGLQWTIKLRQGRVFHDGSPVTADDVKFTYDRQFANKLPGAALSTLPMIASVDVVDPLTVRFNLKTPSPWLLAILGDPWANAVVNKKLVEANTTSADKYPGEKWLATHDAGAGPYLFTSDDPSSRVEFTRDKNWPDWAEGPHLEKVTITNVTEPATQRLQFTNGDVDIATDLTPEDVDALIAQPSISHHDFFTDETITFGFGDWTGKPWADKRVRQAILSAFNFQVASQLAEGYQPVPCGVPPQLENFSNDCTVKYQYDLNLAKSLLKDAGHESDVDITVNIIQGDAISASLFQMWQADLAKIGVKMNANTVPVSVVLQKPEQPRFHGLGSIYVEPMGWLYFWSRPNTPGGFWFNPWYSESNPQAVKFRQIVDAASVEQDNTKRAALYTQALDSLQSEWVWGHFLQPKRRIVFKQALQGYVGFYRQGTYAVPLTTLHWT